MIALLIPFCLLFASKADIFKEKVYKLKEKQTRYVDFQMFGDSYIDYTQAQGTNASLYTLTNIDTDFNISNMFSIETRLEVANTNGGLAQGFATQNYMQGQNIPSSIFGNHGVRSRVLALNIKAENTQIMIGKILPRSGVGASRYNPIFNNDWYGVYGTTLNSGYQNTDKIGAQAEFHKDMKDGNIYNVQFALYKNDNTSLYTAPLFSSNGTNGFSMPSNISHVASANIAGDTTIPQSMLLSVNAKRYIDNINTAYYGLLLRRNATENANGIFAAETSVIGSGAFEHDFGGITAGAFGEIAYINNAYAIKDLTSQYYTISAYSMLEKISVAIVYNKYVMSNVTSLNINSNDLSQLQVSFGYTFEDCALYLAYRNMYDAKAKNTLNGVALNFRYNIGTKNSPFNKM